MNELISDWNLFNHLSSECKSVIKFDARLPEFVFQRLFKQYSLIEYAYLSQQSFGVALATIGRIFGDERINYMSLVPDPVAYYHDHLGFFGLASFTTDTIGERYIQVMTRNGNVDSFLYRGGDIGAFWGSSQEWAIACDRISLEMAVVGTSQDLDLSRLTSIRPMSSLRFSSYIKSQYPVNDSVAAEITRTTLVNYPQDQV